MKKMFIAALFAAFIGTTAFAAPEKNFVSYHVRHEFSKMFDDATNVTWKVTDNFNEAIFVVDNVPTKAFYAHNGDFLGTTKVFAFDKLPVKALKTIMEKYPYPPYKLQECIEYKNADGDVNYYVSLNKNEKTVVLEITPYGSVSVYHNNILK